MLFRKIKTVESLFSAWGQLFTCDCVKQDRGTEGRWFNRNMKHVQRVSTKTQSRLKCDTSY